MYWVNSIGSYLWEERIQYLGEYYQKRQPEGIMVNIQICPREDIFTKDTLFSISFTPQFLL